MIETEIATGETLSLDINQQDIPINPTPMHRECIGNLIIIKIIHHHFHHFHADNLADRNSHGTNKSPNGTINANPSQDAIRQGVPMQQTLAVGTTKTQVEEVPTMGIHDHTTILALTLRHREFILQMLLVLYTLKQSHYKIMHTTTMILTHLNYSSQTHTATLKRIIMLKINKMTIIQSLQIRTMNTIQLDMKRDMDIQMSNTLINILDNHLRWRQWHLKNGVIMLTKCHTPPSW